MAGNDAIKHSGGMDRGNPEILLASLQTLLDTFPDMIFVKDLRLRYAAGTQSFAEMVGKSSMEEVLGRTDFEIFEDKELSMRYTADDYKLLEGGKDLISYLEPLTDKNGQARYSNTSKYILKDDKGEAIGLLGVSRDITKEIKAQQRYQHEIEYLFTLPKDAYAAVFIDVDDWRIVGQRRQIIHNYNVPLFESVAHFLKIASSGVEEDQPEAADFYWDFAPLRLRSIYDSGQRELSMEYRRRMSDGNRHWIRDELQFLANPDNGHLCLMLVIRDIDERMNAHEHLVQAAAMDEMTGLLNRATTKRSIQEFLKNSGAEDIHAAFMIDVDNFKAVNDTFGHKAGDELLTGLAKEIKKCFRESDVVGRIGGDEFFVLAKNMTSREAIAEKAQRLLKDAKEICAPYKSKQPSVSIGISVFRKDGETLTDLYLRADEALYRAKKNGKNQVVFASEE